MRPVTLLITLLLVLHASVFSQKERNLLTGTYSKELLKGKLTMDLIHREFPLYSDRTRWESLDPAYKSRLVKDGESALGYVWQTIPAQAYLEFVRTGERYIMEDVYNQNITALKKLAFAELVEGKGRFIPQLVNGTWAVCEITSWSISAAINLQKAGPGLPDVEEPVIELGAGITVNAMAWIYYQFHDSFDKQSPMIARRIEYEINRRLLEPFYTRNDFWWMALDGKKRMVNNWNIWLNYNMLTTILLLEKDPEKKLDGVYKTMLSADQFINYYKEDGACEEGPAYWAHAGGMLYNYLSLLGLATDNAINLFGNPLVKNIGAYIGKAYIDSSWFLNYADAAARYKADASLVYSYGKATGNTELTGFGAWLAKDQSWDKMPPVETMYGGIRNLFLAREILTAPAARPFTVSAWMPETGIAVARDREGSRDGFYFSALAGHNDESHNHNDVGTSVLFYNGQPVLIDVGSGTYTRQTFGPERYSIWTMRSVYHNVPLINGVEQKAGRQYAAKDVRYSNKKATAVFSLDISAAYPATAKVKNWKRTYELNRGKSFVIRDAYQLDEHRDSTMVYFMTSANVKKIQEGQLLLDTGKDQLEMIYNPSILGYTIEEVPVTDNRLLQSWPPVIYRIGFRVLNKTNTGSHQVLIRKSTN
ncbi:MAG: hypothetical protein EOO09_15780 [Chitinophagaceae bacterium]|nr:MAG: hypothetical protein EOO09_15780 [Chitinophagaceae bacterium]